MKIPAIKQLVEQYGIEQLEEAELAILEERTPGITIEGKDEGEQLTHAMAALEILREVRQSGASVTEALRNYTQRVRKSIS
ncbi:MAG: hypothetical protein V4616_10040 [Bacteroidota bacterium]